MGKNLGPNLGSLGPEGREKIINQTKTTLLVSGLVLLTSKWVLAGEPRQVDVVLYHHDVSHLDGDKHIIRCEGISRSCLGTHYSLTVQYSHSFKS